MLETLRQRNFALLWSAGLISGIGDGALFVALPMYVYQVTGSALATSGMFLAQLVPALLLSSIAGVFVDRWDRKRTMVVTNLILAVTLLGLLGVRSASSIWIVYAVGLVQSITSQFFGPAQGALLPRVIGEDRLVTANSLSALSQNLTWLVGPSIGGLLAAATGLIGVTLLDAVTFLLAAALSAAITESGAVEKPIALDASEAVQLWRQVWREWLQGLGLVRQSRTIAVVLGAFSLASLGEGVFSVMFVIWVREALGGGPEQLGWFVSAQAVGGLVGGAVIARFSTVVSTRLLAGVGSLVFALADMILFAYPLFVPGIWLGIVVIALIGVPGSAIVVSMTTLVQLGPPDEYRGRVFGMIGTTSALFRIAGTLVAGSLGRAVGPVVLLTVMQGGSYVLVAGLILILL